MRPLTDRQKGAMKRLAKAEGNRCYLSPDLAKQLDKRGVAKLTGRKHTRYEWQRPVATLWEVQLTAAGRNVLPILGIALEDRPDWRFGAVPGTQVAEAADGRRAVAYPTDRDHRGAYLVRMYADGDQFDTFADNLNTAWAELTDMAKLAREKRAAINDVENRH
jgi:hypothetical protein